MSVSIKRKAATTEVTTKQVKKPKTNSSITSFFIKPGTSPSSHPSTSQNLLTNAKIPGTHQTAAPGAKSPRKFEKEAWVSSLTSEQKKLLKLEIDTLHESWMKELADDMIKPSFLDLKRFLQKEKENGKKVFPPEKDIYSWSHYTPLPAVKAVILGQDPYHNFSQAHGLSFSVNPPTPPPASLQNIFTALKNDYPTSFRPPPNNTGQLTPWARQGVLMLNACLTVRAHEANSHSNRGWEAFTQRIIDIVAKRQTGGVVFMAWGTPARKRVEKINKARHHILLSVHPSPLSAHRGWFECGHFRKTNEWLTKRYGSCAEIDWNLDKDFVGLRAGEEKQNVSSNGEDASNVTGVALFEDSNCPKSGKETDGLLSTDQGGDSTTNRRNPGEKETDGTTDDAVSPNTLGQPTPDEKRDEPLIADPGENSSNDDADSNEKEILDSRDCAAPLNEVDDDVNSDVTGSR